MARGEKANRTTPARTGQEGFTLVEILMVTIIAGILLTMATLQFNRYTVKTAIESQTKAMYGDLVTVRSQALFEKRRRAVKITSTTFTVYSSGVASGKPVYRKTLQYPVVFSAVPDPIVFSGRGIVEGGTSGGICVEPAGNAGAVDSLVVNATRIQIGKRNGTSCQTSSIETK